MKIKKLDVTFGVPLNKMRFTTAGDWSFTNGTLKVWLTKAPDWRYEAIVFMHEITEFFVCQHDGVTSRKADSFDTLWEKELAKGLHDPKDEAGCDVRSPYHRGHMAGIRMERLFCLLLGVPWKIYCSFWDNFFTKTYGKQV